MLTEVQNNLGWRSATHSFWPGMRAAYRMDYSHPPIWKQWFCGPGPQEILLCCKSAVYNFLVPHLQTLAPPYYYLNLVLCRLYWQVKPSGPLSSFILCNAWHGPGRRWLAGQVRWEIFSPASPQLDNLTLYLVRKTLANLDLVTVY